MEYPYGIKQDDLNNQEDEDIIEMVVGRIKHERRVQRIVDSAIELVNAEEEAARVFEPPIPEAIPPVPEGPAEEQQ